MSEQKQCSVCDGELYANGLCRKHYDRMRRRGTMEAPAPAPKPECTEEACTKSQHSQGLCQMHYRRLRKHGSTAVPQRVNKPGPKPKPGATSHQRLDPEEKRRRAEERAAQKAAETHCDNGHEWKPETTYVYPEGSRYPGKRICKVCRMNWQRERQGLPLVDSIGPWNRDKTHCPQGHEYSEENTLKKNDGSRGCKTCHVHGWRSRMYGVDVEKYAQMMEDQGEACAICDAPFTPENLAHIDHCHDSGKVRGLLCNNCNNGIGRFKDDVARLRAAISYLESHQQ